MKKKNCQDISYPIDKKPTRYTNNPPLTIKKYKDHQHANNTETRKILNTSIQEDNDTAFNVSLSKYA